MQQSHAIEPDNTSPAVQLTRRRQLLMRWIIGAVFVTCLVALSTAWQSWERNDSLAQLTGFPMYFSAIWIGFLSWIRIAWLIYRWHLSIPMFSREQPAWWLSHLAASLLIGAAHLLFDTTLLWLSLSGSFPIMAGFVEKLLRWMPYEVLAYWACLSIMTLITHRRKILSTGQQTYLDRLSFRLDDETRLIPVEKIDYIEACDNYVKIFCGEDRQLLKQTMSHLEQHLDPKKFMRIHRSFIINLNAVDRITRPADAAPAILLNRGKSLPISRRRRSAINRALSNR